MCTQTKKIIKITSIIAIVFVLIASGCLTGVIIHNKYKDNIDNSITDIGGVTDGDGNIIDPDTVHEMPSNLVFLNTSDGLTSPTSVKISVNYKPFGVINYHTKFTIAWANSSSAFATGKAPTDYLTVTPIASDKIGNTANINRIQPFGEQIIITATSEENPEAITQCTVDCLKPIKNIHFNGTFSSNPEFNMDFSNSETTLNVLFWNSLSLTQRKVLAQCSQGGEPTFTSKLIPIYNDNEAGTIVEKISDGSGVAPEYYLSSEFKANLRGQGLEPQDTKNSNNLFWFDPMNILSRLIVGGEQLYTPSQGLGVPLYDCRLNPTLYNKLVAAIANTQGYHFELRLVFRSSLSSTFLTTSFNCTFDKSTIKYAVESITIDKPTLVV